MSTWLDHWDRRYTDSVRLLVEILPVLASEPRFALKGGTAINLFEHDLPRLFGGHRFGLVAGARLCRRCVYLTCSPKPAWEMLAPRVPADFPATFDVHFKGMTAEPIDAEALLESRERLLARVAGWMDGPSCAFLRSVEGEQPDLGLIGLPHAAELPAVRRKLHNLAQRTAAKRMADRGQLEETLARILDS